MRQVVRIRFLPLDRILFAAAAIACAPIPVSAADQIVQVGPGFSFSPSMVTVAPGEMVTWQFNELHTTTSDTQSGPEFWDSGLLSTGSFSHTFNTPGTYPYYCALHSFPGGTLMNGVVQVTGAGATPTASPTSTPISTPTSTPTPTAGAPTATPVGGPGTAGIPDLDAGGRLLLALALAAAGLAALLHSGRR
ncbi:MAG TPA: hypothetical protein VFW15_12815 [Thermoanaerobaculia bacterium]|nr:hypothetical protein [Thermoanaerobaculia bacterium]